MRHLRICSWYQILMNNKYLTHFELFFISEEKNQSPFFSNKSIRCWILFPGNNWHALHVVLQKYILLYSAQKFLSRAVSENVPKINITYESRVDIKEVMLPFTYQKTMCWHYKMANNAKYLFWKFWNWNPSWLNNR